MSAELQLVCYALALVFFVLAAWGVTSVRRPINLGWLGAALITLVPFVAAFQAV